MKKISRKGIFWFLLLTFASTYLVEFWLMMNGFSFAGIPPIFGQLTVAGVMFFPGISAYIVRKFITHEDFKDAGLKLGNRKYYMQVYFLIPILFALIYALTWIFIKSPDFTIRMFMKQYGVSKLPLPPEALIAAIFISTITFAPFLNSIPAFGEEFGWRGFLLPKLLPLGTKKALILSGLIWGLWHAPLILMGFKYGSYSIGGIMFFSVLLIFLGIFIGYFRLVSGSVILAAFIHGIFNAQAYGIWTVIFPDINPLLGGLTGITGIFVFAIVGIWIFQKLNMLKFG